MHTSAKEINEEEQVQLSAHENIFNPLSGKIDVNLGAAASPEDKTHSPNPVCPPNLPIDTIHFRPSGKGAASLVQTPREDLLTGEVQSFRDSNSIARGSSIGAAYSNGKPIRELSHHTREVYRHDGYPLMHTPMDIPRHSVDLPVPLHEDISSLKTPIDSEAECNRLNIHNEGVSPTSQGALLSSEKQTGQTPFLGPPMTSFENITITRRANSGLFPPRNTSERLESSKYPLTSSRRNHHYKFSRRTMASLLPPPAPEERVARRLLQSPIPEFTEGAAPQPDDLASRPYHRKPLVSPSLNDPKGLFESMPSRFPSQGYGTRRTRLPPPPPLPETRYSEDRHSDIANVAPSRYADPWEQHSYTSSCMRDDGRVLNNFFSKRWEEQKRKYSSHNAPQNFTQHSLAGSSAVPTKDSRMNAPIELWKNVMNRSDTWSSRTQKLETEIPAFSSANTISNHFASKPSHNPKLQPPYDSNENAVVGRKAGPISTVKASHAQRRPRSRSIDLDAQDESLGGGPSSFFSTTNNLGSKEGRERGAASHVWASTDEGRMESRDGVQSKPQRSYRSYVDEGTHAAPKERFGVPPSKGVSVQNAEGDDVSLHSQTDTNRKLDLNSVAEERVGSADGDQNTTRLREQTKAEALARHLVRAIQDRKILQENVEELECLVEECNFEIGRLHKLMEEKDSGVVDTQVLNATLHAKEREVALCEDEIKRLNSIVERHMDRLGMREDGVISKLPNGSLWKQAMELDVIVSEVGVARAAQREAEDRADLLASELEAAVDKIRALDKRLVEMEHVASTHRLQVMQSRLGLESEDSRLATSGGTEGSMIPLPTSGETAQWPMAARRVLNRLASHAEGLVVQNSESSRHASLQIQNLEQSCERFRRKLQMKTNELRQLQDECLSLRKEKEMLRLCGTQWYGQLQGVKEEAQLVSELVHISKDNAEEAVLSCITAEAQQDVLTKVHAPGTVVVSQAKQSALSTCKEFAQQVVKDMHVVSRFLSALREMDISENNGYQILRSLADGNVPAESLFLKETTPNRHNDLAIKKENTVSLINQKKDFVVRTVERALEEGLQTKSQARDSKTHTHGLTEESRKSSRHVSRNDAPYDHRESTEAMPLDEIVLHGYKNGEYDDEITEADMLEETDSPNLRKKSTRHGLELELQTSWTAKGIWANSDAKKVVQSASNELQMQTAELRPPPRNGNVDGIADAHSQQRPPSYAPRVEDERKPDKSFISQPSHSLPNSVWRLSDTGDLRRSVKISYGTTILPSEYAHGLLEKGDHCPTENPIMADNTICTGSTMPLSTSQRMSQANEVFLSQVMPSCASYRPEEGILDENDGFSSGVTSHTRQEHVLSSFEKNFPGVTVTFNQQNAQNYDFTSTKGFHPEVMALHESSVQSGGSKRFVENDTKPSDIAETPKPTGTVDTNKDDESPILQRIDNTFHSIGTSETENPQVHRIRDDSTPTKLTNEKDSIDSPAIKFPNARTGEDESRINSSAWKEELEQDSPSNPPRGAAPLLPHETNSSSSPSTSVFRIVHSDDESALYDMPQPMQPKERSATMPPPSYGVEGGSKYAPVENLTGVHEAIPHTIDVTAQGAREAVSCTSLSGSVMNTTGPSRPAHVPREKDRTESTVTASASFSDSATQRFTASSVLNTTLSKYDINIQGSQHFSNSEKQSQSSGLRLSDNDDDDENMPSLSFFNTNDGVGQPQPPQVNVQSLEIMRPENVAFVKDNNKIGEDPPHSTMLPSELVKASASLLFLRSGVFNPTSSIDETDEISVKVPTKALHQQQPDHELAKPLALVSDGSRQGDGANLPRQTSVSDDMDRPALPRLQPSLSAAASSFVAPNPAHAPHQNPATVMNTEKSTLPRRATPAAPESHPALRLRSESSVFAWSSEGEGEEEEKARRPTATPSEVEAMRYPDNEPSGDRSSPPPPAPSEPQVTPPSQETGAKRRVGSSRVAAGIPTGGEKEVSREIHPRTPLRPRTRPNQTSPPASLRPRDAAEGPLKGGGRGDEDVAALAAVLATAMDDAASRATVDGTQGVSLKSGKETKSDAEDHVAAMESDAERRAAVSRILEKIKIRKADAGRMSQNTA
ncbi:unnamed protein product [Phytomonas sp. EM1]|nr:unnamed protein product [Phytomonas sp. EM1]|eukprot:CCW60516.1 unnamed protein product [Phytomonas sp. isolate EM1]